MSKIVEFQKYKDKLKNHQLSEDQKIKTDEQRHREIQDRLKRINELMEKIKKFSMSPPDYSE